MYVRNNRHSTFNAIIAARASNRVLCCTSAKTKQRIVSNSIQRDLKQPLVRVLWTSLNISGLRGFKLQMDKACYLIYLPSPLRWKSARTHMRHWLLLRWLFERPSFSGIISAHSKTHEKLFAMQTWWLRRSEKSTAFDQPPHPSGLKLWALSKQCCAEKWQKASTWLSLAPKLLQVDSWMGSCKKVCWILLAPLHPKLRRNNSMPDA